MFTLSLLLQHSFVLVLSHLSTSTFCNLPLLAHVSMATNPLHLVNFFNLLPPSFFHPQETASLRLRPPPGGYVEHGPGKLVMSAHDSQRVFACEEPEEMLCSALATWCRANLIAESDCHAEDMAFTEKDQQGNLILGLHTTPAVAVLITQTGLCIFPDGTDQQLTSFMVVMRLRSVLNTASLHSRGQGRQRVDTARATYELFPAVGGVLHQRATLLAPAQPDQPQALPGPQIVEIVEPAAESFEDAGNPNSCLLTFPLLTNHEQMPFRSTLPHQLVLPLSSSTHKPPFASSVWTQQRSWSARPVPSALQDFPAFPLYAFSLPGRQTHHVFKQLPLTSSLLKPFRLLQKNKHQLLATTLGPWRPRVPSITERHPLNHPQTSASIRHGPLTGPTWIARQSTIDIATRVEPVSIYRNPHVLLRPGLQLNELYMHSLVAARHYMHIKLYGPMSFSLVRIDLFNHNISLQAAALRALLSSLLFGLLPFFQMTFFAFNMFKCESQSNVHRLSNRKTTRTKLRKFRIARKHIAYTSLTCVITFYLFMSYMHIDSSSGRRCIQPITYTSRTNTRHRRQTYRVPSCMQQLARRCDDNLVHIYTTYEKHQTTLDHYHSWSCWVWVAAFSSIEPLFYLSGPSLPPAHPYKGGTLISTYFLSPIVLTLYELLIHQTLVAQFQVAQLYIHRMLDTQWLYRLTSWYGQARLTTISCDRQLLAWAPTVMKTLGMITLSCSSLLIILLLLLAGDVEVNPGPLPYNNTSTQRMPNNESPTHTEKIADQGPHVAHHPTGPPSPGPITREHLHILN
jgi:hypothetical protein